MRTFATFAILALVSAVDLSRGGMKPTEASPDDSMVGGDPRTWGPPKEGDDEIVGDDPRTWSPTAEISDDDVEDRRPMKDNDGPKPEGEWSEWSEDEEESEAEWSEWSEDEEESESEGEESEDPDMDDVKEFLGACQWIANNTKDQKEIDDAKNIDEKVNKMWNQVKDHPDLEEEREARGDDADREAKEVGRGCIEIYEGEKEERKRKNEPALSPGEFFAAAKTFADNVSEDTMEKRDSKAGFDEIKDKPEFKGWDENAAKEVMDNGIGAANDKMKQEGSRPKNPGNKGGDDKKGGKKGGDKKGGDKKGGDKGEDRPEKPEEDDFAQHRRPTA